MRRNNGDSRRDQQQRRDQQVWILWGKIILDDQLLPDNFMTVSTEIATLPQSTKSRNSDFLVSCGTNSHRDFGLI